MGTRVLVVEDEEPLRRVIVRNLAARGHEVTGASTAGEALAALSTDDFDLMLLDIDLPDRTGWDVIREIRAMGRDVPFVVVSAVRVSPERIAEFKPRAYLAKPFPLDALLRLVARSPHEEMVVGAKEQASDV
jgi:DNA-binding response OmpR family regulator